LGADLITMNLTTTTTTVRQYKPKTYMTSHTPGPWTAHGCTLYAGPNRIAQTWDAEYDGLPTPEMEANAKLAAAAPQLLEALTWALAQISDDLDLDHQESLESAHGLVMRFEEAR
jgi:hypothetical protein